MSRPGFRFSIADGIFIAICGAAFALSYGRLGRLAWGIPVVVGHFFLFCNVFRVRRSTELIWCAIFLVNAFGWTWAAAFDWWSVLAVQLPVTAAFIVAEIRSPRYHGIFAGRSRPDQPVS